MEGRKKVGVARLLNGRLDKILRSLIHRVLRTERSDSQCAYVGKLLDGGIIPGSSLELGVKE